MLCWSSQIRHRSCWVAVLLHSLAFSVAAAGVFAQSALTLDGQSVDPFAASSGKPVVLVFVRTDCPLSNRYAPLLQEMQRAYANKVKFWLVYPDKRATAKQIREHLGEYHYSIPPLRDPHHALVKRAFASITPEAAVFDARGALLYHGRIDNWYVDSGRSRPVATTHELQSVLDSALAGKPSPVLTAPAVGCYISDLE